MKSDIGLIGIGVMGENLALNMESKGVSVSVYDISSEKINKFISGRAKKKNIEGLCSAKDLVDSLKTPRKIMLMVQAGKTVDDIIETLIPLLNKGDIIIDGGNTHFPDTTRRTKYLESKGLLYIGTGISGGEEGALKGPSIMPGGSKAAWESVKPILQAIAAKVEDGTPCCDWIGEDGAGHFVKMVHNGIEYGDMQLICEAYHLMKDLLAMSPDEMHLVFKEWSQGELKSYLIEITRDILAFKDEDGLPLIDKILDKAGQKGTGKWTVISSLDSGVPLTLITESVFARILSSLKEERTAASKVLLGPKTEFMGDKKEFLQDLGKALYAAKIISYTQGYQLMSAAAKQYCWNLNYGGIALMWRGGCIIRSVFLGKIKEAFDNNPQLSNLLLDPFFNEKISSCQQSFRNVVSQAVLNGIPVPALSSALSYFDGYRTECLPANLLQAQRDYFGAHQYERVDRRGGEYFHTNWTGHGGETASTVYSV
ncbi:MAG: decarboxylating NADP(+)-dependent phosphogluconate dehydrogenase [Bacteroidota bacterium]|nr:decarboxylating NADP(+)-dependent phosphogluconate dehydrogenase [Bacteroidota bacterium]MDP4190540.1 decarboxylating NADP(+)-dependent phosphogluconate dehydrogenase [Bacteroidota bacterium]MDP4193657.1 decarboxylating NADP(+)-dependent phosphogluconate dehydrogenase [Bacteroidota bacterium]